MPWRALVLLIACSPVLADQFSYISRDDADRARDFLRPGMTVLDYCRPCGDTSFTKILVKSVILRHTGYALYYQVIVNGKGIDLAYFYVYHEGRWVNLAWALGLEADGVPFYLKLPQNPEAGQVLLNKEVLEKEFPDEEN